MTIEQVAASRGLLRSLRELSWQMEELSGTLPVGTVVHVDRYLADRQQILWTALDEGQSGWSQLYDLERRPLWDLVHN